MWELMLLWGVFLANFMYIEKLNIKNFRNIEELELNLNKNINIFIGNNAQGKTSILESIYVLGLTKTFRSIEELDLIKKDKEISKINGIIKDGRTTKKLDILFSKNGKKLKINGNEEKKTINYISNLNVIMFNPEDLDIIKKSPLIRRNLINIELCQLFSNYMKVLNEYNKILKIRNEYFRKNYEKIDKNYLDIITEKLIDRELIIMEYREKYIENINKDISYIYKRIMKQGNLVVKYEKSINLTTKEDLIKFYQDNYLNEINKKVTLYGPHKDDLGFFLDGDDLKRYGSQGQQRIAILSFKLAEINLFKEVKNSYPIILLDDIFSELDINKRNNLLSFIKSNVQFIITTTDIKNISDKLLEKANVYKIKQGKILK